MRTCSRRLTSRASAPVSDRKPFKNKVPPAPLTGGLQAGNLLKKLSRKIEQLSVAHVVDSATESPKLRGCRPVTTLSSATSPRVCDLFFWEKQVKSYVFPLCWHQLSMPADSRTGRRLRMKVNASVKKMCRKCKIIKRKGIVRVICEDPRHKQRQG